jgi:hypothetical protein
MEVSVSIYQAWQNGLSFQVDYGRAGQNVLFDIFITPDKHDFVVSYSHCLMDRKFFIHRHHFPFVQDQVSRYRPAAGNDGKKTDEEKKIKTQFIAHDILPPNEKYISGRKNSS